MTDELRVLFERELRDQFEFHRMRLRRLGHPDKLAEKMTKHVIDEIRRLVLSDAVEAIVIDGRIAVDGDQMEAAYKNTERARGKP